MCRSFFLTALLAGVVAAQGLGPGKEKHPKISTWKCTKSGGCKKQDTFITIDSGSRPIYQAQNHALGCNTSNATACPDAKTCAKNCVMEGVSEYKDYGVSTKDGSLSLEFYGKNGISSPRVYLLGKDEKKYEMLKLTGQEFTFDVDVSKLPCGMNGALYLSEMRADGGRSKLNPAGASYGTGYCDAQCFVNPWVNGEANIAGSGICCNELDIWEANKRATQLAPHTCSKPSLFTCSGDDCAFDGLCDKNGCGNNPYVVGDKAYYGPGLKVDTNRPFTVVTQFPASKGKLIGMQRLYVQDGKIIENVRIDAEDPDALIDDDYCTANGATKFMGLGAMKGMGESMSRGMVLAMSVWWDQGGFMNWLDSGNAGPCNATEGDPKVIVTVESRPAVVFSQIKWGDIGSTFKAAKRPHA